MSQAMALTIVGTTIVLGVVLAIGLIWPLRSESYRHWSRPARWLFFSAVAAFGLFGAWLWVMLWYTRGGWWAAGAQFLILALSFRDTVMAWPGPSASPETPTPPLTF